MNKKDDNSTAVKSKTLKYQKGKQGIERHVCAIYCAKVSGFELIYGLRDVI
ncbi:11597_t:CDS:2 [Rhizophagus irregularis]|nr:11597_t:CDS:2 [Rhizophagus irregularis]